MAQDDRNALLTHAAQLGAQYLETVADRPAGASATGAELRAILGAPLAAEGCSGLALLDTLAGAAARGTTATQGPRYFGFVTGGSLPAATAADWLVSAWDQNGAVYALSPLLSVVESTVADWLRDLLGLPAPTSVGFVTGAQMANFTALAAARHQVLQAAGWDVETHGLNGAPAIDLLVGEEAHYTVTMALRLLGLGAARARRVPTDGQGRMRASELARMLAGSSGPCIVCAQAGNVNTGAFDPLVEISRHARAGGAWLHVDGAFGLWAAAAPSRRPFAGGMADADSWATDAHKWLNVPYDCGLAFVRDHDALKAAMAITAEYLPTKSEFRNPSDYTPELSRRARGIEVWAALHSLGRAGIAELIERNCAQARRFAEQLSAAGFTILNDVVLNQVLVSFGSAEKTERTIKGIQDDGTCWCGITVWQGVTAMRISVSSWATTDADVDRSVVAMIRIAAKTGW